MSRRSILLPLLLVLGFAGDTRAQPPWPNLGNFTEPPSDDYVRQLASRQLPLYMEDLILAPRDSRSAFLDALNEMAAAPAPGRPTPQAVIESFLAENPGSPYERWLRANLGEAYRKSGDFNLAKPFLEEAWKQRPESDPDKSPSIFHLEIGLSLGMIYAGSGRTSELAEILHATNVENTGSMRSAYRQISNACSLEDNGDMRGLRSGRRAVFLLLHDLGYATPQKMRIHERHVPPEGVSLQEWMDVAAESEAEIQVAFREKGAALIFPSVALWRLGFLSRLAFGRYVQDRGEDFIYYHSPFTDSSALVTASTFEREATGYFLVSANADLPEGWSRVSRQTAQIVLGDYQDNGNPRGVEGILEIDSGNSSERGLSIEIGGAPGVYIIEHSEHLATDFKRIMSAKISHEHPGGRVLWPEVGSSGYFRLR